MKNQKLYIGLIIICIFSSCFVVHKSTKSSFDRCYDKKLTNLEQQIRTDGYYSLSYSYQDNSTNEKYYYNKRIIFTDNGLYAQRDSLDFQNSDSEDKLVWAARGTEVGLYNLNDNTIDVKLIRVGSSTSSCISMIFEIIDMNTIKLISGGDCSNFPSNIDSSIFKYSTAEFVPSDLGIDPKEGFWLLKKKWFWCDKSEFKKWKKDKK